MHIYCILGLSNISSRCKSQHTDFIFKYIRCTEAVRQPESLLCTKAPKTLSNKNSDTESGSVNGERSHEMYFASVYITNKKFYK